MRRLLFSVLVLLWCRGALAAEITLVVVDDAGAPVVGALIWSDDPQSTTPDAPPSGPMAMAQQNKTFVPYVLAVPTGAKVEFPNRDRFRHHVYSFSKGNRFELELYGREEQKYVTFETPGVVAVGCNIHDNMIGYIRVMDTPGALYTNADGAALLNTNDAQSAIFHVWHPNGNNGEPKRVVVDSDQVAVTLEMDAAYDAMASRTE